jgi:hypothetical protein
VAWCGRDETETETLETELKGALGPGSAWNRNRDVKPWVVRDLASVRLVRAEGGEVVLEVRDALVV